MSGSANLFALDGWLEGARENVKSTRNLEVAQYGSAQRTTETLDCLYEAMTVLRNIVVDHLADCASIEQR